MLLLLNWIVSVELNCIIWLSHLVIITIPWYWYFNSLGLTVFIAVALRSFITLCTVLSPWVCNKVELHWIYTLQLRNKLYYTSLCSKKESCDHVFDDKLNWNCPFTTFFCTRITKSIGQRQVFLFSRLTYFVHLLYLGKLSRPKISVKIEQNHESSSVLRYVPSNGRSPLPPGCYG